MKTLEVTDEQYAFIQHLREEIAADVVGKYGFVREQDAVQFLIDNLDEELEIDHDVASSATDDVAASVDAAIEGTADPNELEAISYDETAETGETAGAVESDDESSDPEPDAADGDGDDASDGATETDAESAETDDDPDAADDTSGEADDDDMLDEMMSLLETHDDKWEESASSDYRYTVTLPDGSTEDVQTKDDVRALLFKNYR
ncbi:hypothetical protein [Halopiger djelfimassiliensis]|uniref:hypothetical protein n=1 Tax=Halopiger djelfimassiliensis TaxID=1293047 RepID=UPI000677D918|nr:hypothetical protein [Halopiger djelfimassiliensis]